MESQPIETQSIHIVDTIQHKPKIGLPMIALALDLLPVLLVFLLNSLRGGVSSIIILAMIASPIAGVIIGFCAIREGKQEVGIAGMIISIAAIALPLVFVLAVVMFFIGATTGVITLM